jgi:hypothetical protein
MIYHDSVLVQLIRLVECIPTPQPPPQRPRGRPYLYSEKLFMKALVIMIVRRLHRVGELLAVLEEPTSEMRKVRELVCEEGRSPPRGVPSRGDSKPCPPRFPSRSVAWGVIW